MAFVTMAFLKSFYFCQQNFALIFCYFFVFVYSFQLLNMKLKFFFRILIIISTNMCREISYQFNSLFCLPWNLILFSGCLLCSDVSSHEKKPLTKYKTCDKILQKESPWDIELYLAAERGDIQRLQMILDSGRVHVDCKDKVFIIFFDKKHFEMVLNTKYFLCKKLSIFNLLRFFI